MHFLQLEGLSFVGKGVLFQKWPTLDPDTLPLALRARAISLLQLDIREIAASN